MLPPSRYFDQAARFVARHRWIACLLTAAIDDGKRPVSDIAISSYATFGGSKQWVIGSRQALVRGWGIAGSAHGTSDIRRSAGAYSAWEQSWLLPSWCYWTERQLSTKPGHSTSTASILRARTASVTPAPIPPHPPQAVIAPGSGRGPRASYIAR